MHPYAAEGRSVSIVYLVMAIAAILSAWGLGRGMECLQIQPTWWVETPSVLGFFGLYWKWFDLKLWRNSWIQKRGWLGVPDLRGTWEAHLNTSHDGMPGDLTGQVRIKQTWSKISVVGSWPASESHSVSAVLQQGSGFRQELMYTYVNEPSVAALETMEMHRGTTWLRLDQEADLMEGHYYSGRGRQEYGDLRLNRISSLSSAAF